MTTDLTPEHTARHPDSDSYSEVIAAYQYVQSVIPTADVQSSAGGYAWHGWALREAFLAGCTHARAALADEPAVPQPPTEDRAGRLAVAAALRALNTQLGHNVLGVRSVDCSQIELIAQELEASL